jgi:hypothetical protein
VSEVMGTPRAHSGMVVVVMCRFSRSLVICCVTLVAILPVSSLRTSLATLVKIIRAWKRTGVVQPDHRRGHSGLRLERCATEFHEANSCGRRPVGPRSRRC